MTKFKTIGILAVAAIAGVLAQSCEGLVNINEVNDINTEVTLAPGTEVTVMSEYSKTLGELLTETDGGAITVTAEGDYMINYKIVDNMELGDGFSFDAASFALNVNDRFDKSISISDKASIPANTPVSYNASDRTAVQNYLQHLGTNVDIDFFESLLTQTVDFDFATDFSINEFPKLIKRVQKAELDGSISFSIVPSGIPFGKFLFKKGFEIAFPSYFQFSSCDNNSFTLSEGNRLVANQDVQVILDKGLSFNLKLASLDFGNGIATGGKLALDGKVAVKGVASLDPSDFTGETIEIDLAKDPAIAALLGFTPGEAGHIVKAVKGDIPIVDLGIACTYSTEKVAIRNATIQISKDALPSFDTDEFGFDIKEKLPRELLEGNPVIELPEVQVTMALESTLPFSFGLNANLVTLANSTVAHDYQLGPLQFPGNGTNTIYSLGSHADGVEGDIIYKKINDLGKILNPIPDRIEVKDFDVIFDENQWITVESGKNYGGKISAGIEAPLAFTADTKLTINMDLEDMEVNLDQVSGYLKGDTKAVVKFSYENEIPLNFGLTLTVKDADKKVMPNVKINPETVTVLAANANGASKQDVEIAIVIPEDNKMIRNISFNVSASASDPKLRLRPSQKISIKNVKFSLPEGVTTDLKDLVK